MQTKTLKAVRRLTFGTILLTLTAASVAASVPASAAAPAPVRPATTTTTTHLTLPASLCAAIRAALTPANPVPCTATLVERSTTLPARTASAVAAGCFVGSRSFNDSFTDGVWPIFFWGVQLNSTFTWTGCSNPTVQITTCRENFTAYGYTLSDIHCSNYTTGIPSRAALLEGYAHLPTNAANYYFFVRRECYSGGPGTCNYAWG
jgi:hypothetical protein